MSTAQVYTTTDEEFVEALYRAILDRDPDPSGLADHVAALKNGTRRSEMRQSFLNSREYANKNGVDRDPNRLTASKFIEQLRVIGDSHSQTVNGLLLTWGDGTPYGFGASRFIPGLDANKCFDFAQQRINKHIAYALHDFGLVKRVAAEAPQRGILWDGETAYEPIRVGPPRPVLFTVGELDARVLLAAIPAGADIDPALFDDREAPINIRAAIVPAHTVRSAFTERFRPMFRMLAELKQLGILAYVASITPPTADNELYQHSTGVASADAVVRFHLYRAVSMLLKQACASMTVGFIDIWGKVADRDRVRDDVLLPDGVHYNAKAASELICVYAMEARV